MSENKILSAYLTSILGVFSGLLTNLWLLKALTIHVSATDFGLYSYIFQISSYLLILQLGMDFSVSRQIAEYLGKGEKENANIAFWELKRFNRYGVLIVSLLVLVLAIMFYAGIGVDPLRKELAVKLILLVGVNQVLIFIQRPFTSALIGGHQQVTVNITTVIRTIVTTLLAYWLLIKGNGVLSTPIAEVFTQLVASSVIAYLGKSKLKWLGKKPSIKDHAVFKHLFRFAFFSTLGGVAWTIEATSDVLIIRHVMKDITLLGVFVIWWRFPQMFFDMATRLASSALPVFAGSLAANDGSAKITLTKMFMVVLFFASVSIIGISLWLPGFINFWFPSEYSGFNFFNPFHFAICMAVLVALRILGNLFAIFLLSSGNTRLTTRLAWIQAGLKLVLSFFSVYQWGVIGLVMASCISASLQVIVYSFHLLKARFIPGSMLVHAAMVLILSVLLVLLIRDMPTPTSTGQLMLGVFVTLLIWIFVFLSISWPYKLYRPIIGQFVKQLNSKLFV